MKLYSEVNIPASPIRISYSDKMMSIGSCFAENTGNVLLKNKFTIDVNPFGVLYNPKSVALAVRKLLQPAEQTADGLFFHEGLFHSFAHHSSFSAVSATDCLRKINERLSVSSSNILQINRLFITFGTAWFFRLKTTGEVVANCHKLPDGMFDRERLTIPAIVDEWDSVLSALREANNDVKVIFSISPVRHWKDGAHDNQISKSILLIAVEMLRERFPDMVAYFPAYEIMMDELRDYRFYAEDMFHPSEMAVRYIFEAFNAAFMDDETRSALNEVGDIRKALSHNMFHPESEASKHFIRKTLLKIEQLKAKSPYICFDKEVDELKNPCN